MVTDYFAKWVEAIPTKQTKSKVVINFLVENIITRFVTLLRLITDNQMHFRFDEFKDFSNTYGITISYAASYHPQENG